MTASTLKSDGDADPIFERLAWWEEGCRRGEEPTLDELCVGRPELREELQRRIERRRRLLPQMLVNTLVDAQSPDRVALPEIEGYELLEVLGSGGMGIVYKARQLALNRIVAMKMILTGFGSSLSDLARFRAEAETVAKLQHGNIVQIYEIGEADGRPFLSLEFLGGGTLAELIAGRPVAPQRVANLMRLLSEAAQHAHEAGVIHRDLKPMNVLMTAQGMPKITDFGLAKRLDFETGQTQTGAVLGTPCYMAPEQASGQTRDIGPRTDVYALGVILYEMLTGRVPFAGESLLETLEQVRSHDPVPPRQLVPKVPRDLEVICLKCLEKASGQRYASAGELSQELQRYLDGEAIWARPPSVLNQVVREVFRTQHNFPQYREWSRYFLILGPIPFIIHLILTLVLRTSPYFPQVAVATTFVTFSTIQVIVFRLAREGLQFFPARVRRHAHVVMNANLVAEILSLFAVWWNTPTDQPQHLLMVYPLWSITVGVAFFSLASEIGFFYVIGAIAFCLSIFAILWPEWSPVVASLVFLSNIGGQGLIYLWLAQRLEQDRIGATDSPSLRPQSASK